MARNQLPEGVGKKIVEALKRQAEADITPVASVDNSISSNVQQAEIPELKDISFEPIQQTPAPAPAPAPIPTPVVTENLIIEEDTTANTFDIPSMKEDVYSHSIKETVKEAPFFKAGSETTTITFNNVAPTPSVSTMQTFTSGIPLSEEPKKPVMPAMVTISIPTNVAVLKNLIASLPVGVTKQTGAQIIRQTLEAMGVPMASVLKDAQEIQEELNTNTRECMLKIQEFKTNIMQLEQTVQEYQKNITQINDLVSLFLLTDRK